MALVSSARRSSSKKQKGQKNVYPKTPVFAAAGVSAVVTTKRPVWERTVEGAEQQAPILAKKRPIHWSAITSFVFGISSLLLYLAALIFDFLTFPVFLVLCGLWLALIIFSIIGLIKTGPEKPYRGLGLTVAGLLSFLGLYLLFLLLLLVLLLLGY